MSQVKEYSPKSNKTVANVINSRSSSANIVNRGSGNSIKQAEEYTYEPVLYSGQYEMLEFEGCLNPSGEPALMVGLWDKCDNQWMEGFPRIISYNGIPYCGEEEFECCEPTKEPKFISASTRSQYGKYGDQGFLNTGTLLTDELSSTSIDLDGTPTPFINAGSQGSDPYQPRPVFKSKTTTLNNISECNDMVVCSEFSGSWKLLNLSWPKSEEYAGITTTSLCIVCDGVEVDSKENTIQRGLGDADKEFFAVRDTNISISGPEKCLKPGESSSICSIVKSAGYNQSAPVEDANFNIPDAIVFLNLTLDNSQKAWCK